VCVRARAYTYVREKGTNVQRMYTRHTIQ